MIQFPIKTYLTLMNKFERATWVQYNPFADQTEVVLKTPTQGGAWIGSVAKILNDGQLEWFPDIGHRVNPDGITRSDILEDLRFLASQEEKRKQKLLDGG